MNQKKRGLGRGLSEMGLTELLGHLNTDAAIQNPDRVKNVSLEELPIQSLFPSSFQPRKIFSDQALAELTQSIETQGVLQPILVRATDGGYEIIAGERRWRAAKMAGLKKIPVIIREISNQEASIVALVENIQRADLNPMEESHALQRLIDEHQFTHEKAAEAVGKSRTAVTNLLRLQKLHDEVKNSLEQGHIEMGHARALLAVESTLQRKMAREIAEKKLSVRETERLIQKIQHPQQEVLKKSIDPDIARLQRELADKLSAAVSLKHSSGGKGKLVISYNSLDELEGILQHIS